MSSDPTKETITEAAPANEEVVDEFAFDMTMKKKKKKVVKKVQIEEDGDVTVAGAAGSEANPSVDAEASMIANSANADEATGASSGGAGSWLDSDREYTYRELLQRVFGILRQNNPDLAGEKRKFTIVPPQITREGSKKTGFANITDLCRRMRRPPEHVTQFLLTELGTTGSSDASQRLTIKGRFQQLQIENVLRRYIVEYVTCKTCHSPDTMLTKENRLYFLKCESCGSSRSVAAIKSGFQAQTGRRAAQRQ